MRQWCLAACLLLDVNIAPAATPQAAPLQIAGASQWDMPASASGRNYRIFVSAPGKSAPAQGYGVLYVLDANAMFLTAVEAVRAFERRPDVPKDIATVVVGIGYPDGSDIQAERTHDLTPVAAENPRTRQVAGGGADAFLAFIESDLKPQIGGMFPLDKRKQTIFGHSFGGLFVLHTLARQPEAFPIRIAASPSIWYGGGGFIKDELQKLAQSRTQDDPRLRVLLMAGEFEQAPSPAMRAQPHAEEAIRGLAMRKQIDNAREATALLGAAPGIEARFDEIAGEDHGSVIPAAIGRAVAFMLWPPLPVPEVPSAQAYLQMTPEQRYDLRVRDLPDIDRIPWLNQLKQTLQAGLTVEQNKALHDERNRMDQENGTQPHAVNAAN
ncbi:MAG: alpha/beta hydrolase-fold protein [Pseudoxanthomonas sp.]